MRYRIKDYTIYKPAGDVQLIIFEPKDLTIEDIRLIVNETKNTVICSSMQKSNVIVAATQDHRTTVTVPKSVCVLDTTDQLTIEIDNGETLAIPTDYAKEQTLNEKSQAIQDKIDNIPTPVIPTDYAKENNATNNKLELLNKLNMLINMIGPGDSFANFVAAPNLIYLGTASYDEETNTIYIGEDGYYDENEQTIFING